MAAKKNAKKTTATKTKRAPAGAPRTTKAKPKKTATKRATKAKAEKA